MWNYKNISQLLLLAYNFLELQIIYTSYAMHIEVSKQNFVKVSKIPLYKTSNITTVLGGCSAM